MLDYQLRNLRLQFHKTQTEIAEMLGITQQAYAHYENNHRSPNAEVLCTLADYYHVPVGYLLGRTNEPLSPLWDKPSGGLPEPKGNSMLRLKQLRVESGLLQKDIAAYLHIDRTAYVRYENGVNEPKIETLILLADFFGVTLDYLLGRTDIKKPVPQMESGKRDELSASEQEMLSLFRSLNDEGQTAALATLRGLAASPAYIKSPVSGQVQEEIG